jgi:hypothetical protein
MKLLFKEKKLNLQGYQIFIFRRKKCSLNYLKHEISLDFFGLYIFEALTLFLKPDMSVNTPIFLRGLQRWRGCYCHEIQPLVFKILKTKNPSKLTALRDFIYRIAVPFREFRGLHHTTHATATHWRMCVCTSFFLLIGQNNFCC